MPLAVDSAPSPLPSAGQASAFRVDRACAEASNACCVAVPRSSASAPVSVAVAPMVPFSAVRLSMVPSSVVFACCSWSMACMMVPDESGRASDRAFRLFRSVALRSVMSCSVARLPATWPLAAVIAPAAEARAPVALALAWESRALPVSNAVEAVPTVCPSAVRVVSSRPERPSSPLAASAPSRRTSSSVARTPVRSIGSSASVTSAMAERIEATASCASASARSALARAASAESDAWASAWLTDCATTSLTVETNVALT